MSSSKVIESGISGDKVIIGEYRADLEADRVAEERIKSQFLGINILTTIEGKKLVPIQELVKIEEQIQGEKSEVEQRGYIKGYEEGLSKGHEEAQKVIDNFASLLKDAERQRRVLFDEAHRKILELVTKIASKVTYNAARLDPDITASIIAGTIAKLVEKSKIKVKVNPDHLPHIEQQIDRFKGDSTAIKDIAIEPDSRVRYGGCFIETPTGDIDARIDSQMEIVGKALDIDRVDE
jgi:flagellar assembly protein FliH